MIYGNVYEKSQERIIGAKSCDFLATVLPALELNDERERGSQHLTGWKKWKKKLFSIVVPNGANLYSWEQCVVKLMWLC